jgi:DNA polymerase III delta subunit
MTIYFVQGADPVLRDREVQRLVGELLGGDDHSLALDDHTLASRRRGADADSGSGDEESAGEGTVELPAFASVVNALQSPPFMTACRVVVVREIANMSADQSRWLAEWMADPLDGVHLVLVTGGGRVPAALDKACKAHAEVVAPATEKTADVLARELKDAQLRLAPAAASRVAAHLGDDAGRVPELVDLLQSAYGSHDVLDLDTVESYLGELGTAGRYDLANAIDRGDLATSLEVLHRLLTATSAAQPKPLHPLQVMATLVYHYQRLLRLDDPAIVTKEQAAQVLGLRSAAGARFPLEAARRLGSDGLREAMGLLAGAELDLRGAGGLDERTVMDVLVARLAALNRRLSRAARR